MELAGRVVYIAWLKVGVDGASLSGCMFWSGKFPADQNSSQYSRGGCGYARGILFCNRA